MNIGDIGSFGSIFARKPERFRGAVIFEASTIAMAEFAHEAGATAVLLTDPVPHAMDDYYLLRATRKAIYPNIIIVKVRVGHYTEAEELEALGLADYIDENELLGVVDEQFIDKKHFEIRFICGCANLTEALRRVNEGACALRVQGGSGDIADTLKLVKSLLGEVAALAGLDETQLLARAAEMGVPPNLLMKTKQLRRLPVPLLAAGSIVTAADAALMIHHRCDGVFVHSKVLVGKKREEEVARAKKIVRFVADAWQTVHANVEN